MVRFGGFSIRTIRTSNVSDAAVHEELLNYRPDVGNILLSNLPSKEFIKILYDASLVELNSILFETSSK